jgi:glycosyl transferase family 2
VSDTEEVVDRLTPSSPGGSPTGAKDFHEPVDLAQIPIPERDRAIRALSLPITTPERRWATPRLDGTGSVPLPEQEVDEHGARPAPGTSPSKERRYVNQPADLSALEAHHAPKASLATEDFASRLTVEDIEVVQDLDDVQIIADPVRVISDSLLSLARVSVVIPTLNEADNLPHVFARMPSAAFEVILVDGNSTDGTVEVAKGLWPDLKVITQTGKGKGNALTSGFWAATGDIVVMLDGDGSSDPAEIPRFVAALLAGADFAKGSRFIAGGGSADITMLRRVGNWVLAKVVNGIWGGQYSDLCYGYNAFWRRCLPFITPDCEGFEVETLINIRASRACLKIHEVPSFEHDRRHGVSNLNARRDGMRVLRTIISEGVRP